MTPVEYVLDPRFEVIGCAVRDPDLGPTRFLDDTQLRIYLATLPEKVVIVSHNALFDMVVLAWHYGYVPTLMADTMGMARAMLGHRLRSLSLDSVVAFLKLGVKGKTVLKVQGMTRADIIAAGFYNEYAEYSCMDADLCFGIYQWAIANGFPPHELLVMDTVLRCAVMPRFVLNQTALAEHLHNVQQAKADLFDRCGLASRDDLMSNDRFARVLMDLGVDPPTKISPATGKETYAFARTDAEFMDLEEHPNPTVQALISARLGIKSTLEETRTERFIAISRLQWGDGQQGLLPVPLRYSGAHTHRLSGDWKLNCMHPDVEILTPAGWQRVEDWQSTTPVMQWWPDGGMTFDTSAGKVSRAETELVWFDAPFVKGGFTKDHRMVSLRRGAAVETTAGWIAEHSGLDNIPVAGVYPGGTSPLAEDQVRLLVALAADGSSIYESGPRNKGAPRASVKTNGWQWGFHKSRKADRLRGLLVICGVKFNEWSNGVRTNFTIRQSETPSWLKKGFGLWCLTLSGKSMDALLDELVHWDGFRNSRSGSPTFCTSVSEQAKWVQTIAHIRGRPATTRAYTKAGKDHHYVYFRKSRLSSIAGNQKKILPYSGMVYCPQVESTYVIARYGAGIFITGNCQNLPARGNNKLRSAIEAPPGYKVLAVDSSQIEARMAAVFCGAWEMVDQFDNKEDVYSTFASGVFGVQVHKSTHPVERFVGKTGILGLQYGLGWPKFQGTVAMQSKQQLGQEVLLTDDVAAKTVNTYRRRYFQIPAMWKVLERMLPLMTQDSLHTYLGPLLFTKEAITLPSGLKLHYHNLHCDEHGQWRFEYGGKWKYIYGGKMLENIIQALARICIMDAAVRIRLWADREGIPIWLNLQVHDELVYVVPDELVEIVDAKVEEEMNRRPSWAPRLPLASEAGFGRSFGDT
jgi:DNA polymerase family A